jgi:hypothetical protein
LDKSIWLLEDDKKRKKVARRYPRQWTRRNTFQIIRRGEEYEPESLAVMQAALDRQLKKCGRTYSILRDS